MLTYSHQNIDQSDIEVVTKALQDDFLTGGKKVEEFENALASYVGVKYACVLNSATSALHLAFEALEVKNKLVLSPAISFAATSNTALMAGARVEFIDIKEDGNIDEKELEKRLLRAKKNGEKLGAIVGVDFAGLSVESDELLALSKAYEVPFLDDASHALGSTYKGEKVGKKAHLSVFSFHPVKPITTLEGGAVVSDDERLIQKIKLLRSHGIVKNELWDYDMLELGYNYRLSDVACALGLNQLKKLDINLEKREKIAKFYDEKFKDNPFFKTIQIPSYKTSSRHLYPIFLNESLAYKKAELFKALLEKGIGTQVHYKPSYEFSFYKKLMGEIHLKNADKFYKSELSIPCHQQMSLEQAHFVSENLLTLCEKL